MFFVTPGDTETNPLSKLAVNASRVRKGHTVNHRVNHRLPLAKNARVESTVTAVPDNHLLPSANPAQRVITAVGVTLATHVNPVNTEIKNPRVRGEAVRIAWPGDTPINQPASFVQIVSGDITVLVVVEGKLAPPGNFIASFSKSQLPLVKVAVQARVLLLVTQVAQLASRGNIQEETNRVKTVLRIHTATRRSEPR